MTTSAVTVRILSVIPECFYCCFCRCAAIPVPCFAFLACADVTPMCDMLNATIHICSPIKHSTYIYCPKYCGVCGEWDIVKQYMFSSFSVLTEKHKFNYSFRIYTTVRKYTVNSGLFCVTLTRTIVQGWHIEYVWRLSFWKNIIYPKDVCRLF